MELRAAHLLLCRSHCPVVTLSYGLLAAVLRHTQEEDTLTHMEWKPFLGCCMPVCVLLWSDRQALCSICVNMLLLDHIE